jgi:hypothetical protein
MAHAAGIHTHAAVESRVENTVPPQCVEAGGIRTPLAFKRFDVVVARCELNYARQRFSPASLRFHCRRLLQNHPPAPRRDRGEHGSIANAPLTLRVGPWISERRLIGTLTWDPSLLGSSWSCPVDILASVAIVARWIASIRRLRATAN